MGDEWFKDNKDLNAAFGEFLEEVDYKELPKEKKINFISFARSEYKKAKKIIMNCSTTET